MREQPQPCTCQPGEPFGSCMGCEHIPPLTDEQYEKVRRLAKGTPSPPRVRIEVGRIYVWEHDDPTACERVRVRAIVVNENGEAWIETVSLSQSGVGPCWNDADRFQEACIYGD